MDWEFPVGKKPRLNQVARHAGIKGSISLTDKDIDRKVFFRHGWFPLDSRFRGNDIWKDAFVTSATSASIPVFVCDTVWQTPALRV